MKNISNKSTFAIHLIFSKISNLFWGGGGSSHSTIFHSYRDVMNADEGLEILWEFFSLPATPAVTQGIRL